MSVSERKTHDPLTQSIQSIPSETLFVPVGNSIEPMPIYYGTDFTGEVIGPFLTRGAVDWCLATRANVRDSKSFRGA